MDTVRALLVDVFTDQPLSGIVTGVVPDASGLSEQQRGEIANELSVGETAFVVDHENYDYQLQFHTPNNQLGYSGYATIGAFVGLTELDRITPGTYEVLSQDGVVTIEVTEEPTVWQTGHERSVQEIDIDSQRISEILDVPSDSLAVGKLPPAIATVDGPWLVVPISYFSELREMTPDWVNLADLCRELEVTGIYAFTFDTLESRSTAHARVFVPDGQRECAGYRMAAGAAGVYIRQMGALDGDSPDGLRFEQGDQIGRPARIAVEVGERVRVGGKGLVTLNGELRFTDQSDEDIIVA